MECLGLPSKSHWVRRHGLERADGRVTMIHGVRW